MPGASMLGLLPFTARTGGIPKSSRKKHRKQWPPLKDYESSSYLLLFRAGDSLQRVADEPGLRQCDAMGFAASLALAEALAAGFLLTFNQFYTGTNKLAGAGGVSLKGKNHRVISVGVCDGALPGRGNDAYTVISMHVPSQMCV